MLEMGKMLLYKSNCGLQIEQRSSATRAGDKLRLAGTYTGSLQYAESISIDIRYIDFTFIA